MIAGALSVVRVRRFFRSLIVLLLSMHLAGCTALAYYTQATFGHAKLTFSKQSLADAIDDSDSNTARQLRMVEPVLKFAINRIGLPATKSYKTYVALPQPYPVYNVIAAPKDSLEPWQWCYLVIGCASYRGYGPWMLWISCMCSPPIPKYPAPVNSTCTMLVALSSASTRSI
ncbi:MAG: aminopeptidase, partial [Pseudomonadota bacterium]